MASWDSPIRTGGWNFGSTPSVSFERLDNPVQAQPSQEDSRIAFYRDKFLEAETERKRLERHVEFLSDQLQKVQRLHDLDYQLWLLREKDNGTPRRTPSICGGRSGDGYVKVATAITGNYQRHRPWSKKVVQALNTTNTTTPEQTAEAEDSDPELAATLLRLLEEGNNE